MTAVVEQYTEKLTKASRSSDERDQDSLHILPLNVLPLETAGLKRIKYIRRFGASNFPIQLDLGRRWILSSQANMGSFGSTGRERNKNPVPINGGKGCNSGA